jgi:hypothetical protein
VLDAPVPDVPPLADAPLADAPLEDALLALVSEAEPELEAVPRAANSACSSEALLALPDDDPLDDAPLDDEP